MKHLVIYIITLALIASLYSMQKEYTLLLPKELRIEVMNAFTDKLELSIQNKTIEEIKDSYTALIKHLSAFEQNPNLKIAIRYYKDEALQIVASLINYFKERGEKAPLEWLASIFVNTHYQKEVKAILENFPAQAQASNNANNAQNQRILPSGTNAHSCKIITNDQQTLTVDKAFLEESSTLKNLRSDLGDVDSIELPDGTPLTAQQLSKIIELKDKAKGNREDLTAAINTLEIDALLEIIKGANYLHLSDMLDASLKAFAAKLSINDIENYLGEQPVLPKELMQQLLKLIGATNCLVYRSSFEKPLKRINDSSLFGGYLKSAKFIPGTSSLIVWAADCSTRLFNFNANKEITYLTKNSDFLKVIPFSMSRPLFTASLLAASFRTPTFTIFELRDLKNNASPSQLRCPHLCSLVGLSPDGNLVAVNNEDSIYLSNRDSVTAPKILPKTGWPTLSPDGAFIFINPKIHSNDSDKKCCLYDIKADQINHSFIDIESKFYTACFSPNSSLIAIGCDNGATYLWDIKAKNYKNILDAKKNERVTALCFSADGGLIAIGFIDGTVSVSEVATGKCLCSFASCKHGSMPHSLFFNSDNTVLVCNVLGKIESLVTILDLNSSTCIYTLKGERPVLEGYNSDYSLISGFDDKRKFVGIWAIDKNLDHYLCNEITADQSLLLICIFKAIQVNSRVIVSNNSKLKAIYDSITNEKLKKLVGTHISFYEPAA